MAQYPNYVWGSYESQSVTADQERTVNLYPEQMESEGATSKWAMYPTPGVEVIVDAADSADIFGGTPTSGGPGRGMLTVTYLGATNQFLVIGSELYSYVEALSQLVPLGDVGQDNNPVTMSYGGDASGGQVFITSNNNGFIYDLNAATFTQVRTGSTTQGDFCDGYFLALDADTGTVYVSDLFDGSTWDPTQSFQRSLAADPWVAMKVSNRMVYLFGTETSEIWYNAGSVPLPFIPHPSGFFNYGIVAPYSAKVVDGAVYWLGATSQGRGMILRCTGFTPEEIQTYPVQVAMNGYSYLADGIGDTYNDLGHSFYILSLPQAGSTWAFDNKTSIWAERGTWINADNNYTAWRPLFHAQEGGEHRMLDRDGTALYRMSSDLGYDVESLEIRRLRRAPALVNELQRVSYSQFEVDLEPGLGLATGQGSDPQVMMRFSDDGGKTWSSEYWRSAGEIGEWFKRVIWFRLGQGRRRVFEIAMSDPIPWRITNAYVRIRRPSREEAA